MLVGMWGVCFTYGAWFAVEGLVDAGLAPTFDIASSQHRITGIDIRHWSVDVTFSCASNVRTAGE